MWYGPCLCLLGRMYDWGPQEGQRMESALWNAYKTDGDEEARAALLLRHLRLVAHVARNLRKAGRQGEELDDLLSAGTIGLIDAVQNFEPARGLAFSTFAAPRIRGAILDDFRRRDHASRSTRRKRRDLARTRERLAASLNRDPTDREVAEELGIEVEKLWGWKHDAERAVHVSLDRPLDPAAPRASIPEEVVTDPGARDCDHLLTGQEEALILRDELLKLKERDRLVLSLYYFEGLKLHEIGAMLGVTESRISQIQTRGLRILRERMSHLREPIDA